MEYPADPADPCSPEGHWEWVVGQLESIRTGFESLQAERMAIRDFQALIASRLAAIKAYVSLRYPHRMWPEDNWQ